MAAYFDTTNDKTLLPNDLRDSPELANVAALAEAAVIGYYTSTPPYYLYTAWMGYLQQGGGQPGGIGLWGGWFNERGIGEDITNPSPPSGAVTPQIRVYLAGYKADASSSLVDPNLKAALKKTVAIVIRWWMTGWGREPAVRNSQDMQQKVRTYSANADDAFPPDWNLLLEPYSTKPVYWGL